MKFNGGAWSLVSCDSQSYQEEQAYVKSPVVRGVIALVEKQGEWQGTASELLTAVCEECDAPLALMKPPEFGRELQHFIIPLREKNNIRVSMRRAGKTRKRVLYLEPIGRCAQQSMFDGQAMQPVDDEDNPF